LLSASQHGFTLAKIFDSVNELYQQFFKNLKKFPANFTNILNEVDKFESLPRPRQQKMSSIYM